MATFPSPRPSLGPGLSPALTGAGAPQLSTGLQLWGRRCYPRNIKDPERAPGSSRLGALQLWFLTWERSRSRAGGKRKRFTVFWFTQLQEMSSAPSPELRRPCHRTGAELEYFLPEWPMSCPFQTQETQESPAPPTCTPKKTHQGVLLGVSTAEQQEMCGALSSTTAMSFLGRLCSRQEVTTAMLTAALVGDRA